MIGTVGLLLRAKRGDLIPAIEPSPDALDAVGFGIDGGLRRTALDLAGEGTPDSRQRPHNIEVVDRISRSQA